MPLSYVPRSVTKRPVCVCLIAPWLSRWRASRDGYELARVNVPGAVGRALPTGPNGTRPTLIRRSTDDALCVPWFE